MLRGLLFLLEEVCLTEDIENLGLRKVALPQCSLDRKSVV